MLIKAHFFDAVKMQRRLSFIPAGNWFRHARRSSPKFDAFSLNTFEINDETHLVARSEPPTG